MVPRTVQGALAAAGRGTKDVVDASGSTEFFSVESLDSLECWSCFDGTDCWVACDLNELSDFDVELSVLNSLEASAEAFKLGSPVWCISECYIVSEKI